MMSVSHVYVPESPTSVIGFSVRRAVWMWVEITSVSKRSACLRKRSISPGPARPWRRGPVVHFGGRHELPALGEAVTSVGLRLAARGIDGSRIASGAWSPG